MMDSRPERYPHYQWFRQPGKLPNTVEVPFKEGQS